MTRGTNVCCSESIIEIAGILLLCPGYFNEIPPLDKILHHLPPPPHRPAALPQHQHLLPPAGGPAPVLPRHWVHPGDQRGEGASGPRCPGVGGLSSGGPHYREVRLMISWECYKSVNVLSSCPPPSCEWEVWVTCCAYCHVNTTQD